MALFRRLFFGLAFLSVVLGGFIIATPNAFAAKQCQCGCSAPGGALQPNGGPETCTTNADCTIAFCQAQCGLNGPGVVPAPLRGSRVYQCVEQGAAAPAPDTAPTPGGGTALTPGANTNPAAPGAAGETSPGGTARRGTCAFQCTGTGQGATPVTAQIIESCSDDSDCVTSCTNRCPVPGNGPTGNGLSGSQSQNLVCASSPAPRCIFPQDDTTNNATAPSSTAGSLRFILPACTETGNCVLSDIVNTGIRFANFLLALSGVVFLMTFLYAGAKLLFLAYDSSAINQAKKMITGAIVGMVIIMVAGVAVRFVSSSLGVSSSTTRLPGATTRSTTN